MPDMQPDDIIKNDSEALGVYEPQPDQSDLEREREERSKMSSTVPILEELVEWFDLAISSCDSIKNLDLNSETTLQNQVKANMIVKELLSQKRAQLLARTWNFQNQSGGLDEPTE